MTDTSEGAGPASDQPDHPYSTAEALPLPEPAHLFRAIAGRGSSASPLDGWARELGDMHAELIPLRLNKNMAQTYPAGEQIRVAIDRAVGEIDVWAACNLPRMKSARKHTHTLGEVISRLAKLYAEAWWTVLHAADSETRHQAWFHLGEAREGYEEMVNEIRRRHLQLPLGCTGLRGGAD
ncbi:hypothetical protein [Nocardia sp. BMG111209]|uniref:hypothetical protein n=1 Tax=Nocardia sp. BMG111209 TaxID=1160137 RepID=UPI0012DE1F21|nr:hypothetical protein [Nocardia sp. BMG111209]